MALNQNSIQSQPTTCQDSLGSILLFAHYFQMVVEQLSGQPIGSKKQRSQNTKQKTFFVIYHGLGDEFGIIGGICDLTSS